jgi:hypothetical protein
MNTISNWSNNLVKEIKVLENIQQQIKTKIDAFVTDSQTVSPDEWMSKHELFLVSLHQETKELAFMLDTQHNRSIVISKLYDNAQKESTLVLDNYDKMEECVELLRSELKNIIKKIYSISTLELEYHEKLFSACTKLGTVVRHEYNQDYDDFRKILKFIYRHEQYIIFQLNIDAMLFTAINIIHKFISIIDNKANMSEINKLWTTSDHSWRM